MNKKTATIVLGASLAAVLIISYVLYAGLTRNGKSASSLSPVSSPSFFAGTSSIVLKASSSAQRIVSAASSAVSGNAVSSAPEKAASSAPQSTGKATASSAAESVNPKDLAPNFTVYDASGKAVKLSDFRGTPVVINFWASWCGYCKEEMPDFNDVYKQYNGSVKFLFIDWVDGKRETQKTGSAYLKQQGYSFPTYYDLNQDAVNAYGLTGIPATFFVDRLGRLAGSSPGFTSKSQLLQGIEKIR